MKLQGFLRDFCKSLDRMEEEMGCLCRGFGKEKPKKKLCNGREKMPFPERKLPPDYRPPCGRNTCCCENRKEK